MKIAKNIIYAIFCSVLLMGCEEIDFLNLKKDNPLDENMQGGTAVKFSSYNVFKDDNDNKAVNKGETIELKVSLKNTGKNDAKSVRATFSTASPYISDFTPTSQVDYGDIPVHYTEKWADYRGNKGMYATHATYYTIKFTVSNSIPVNTDIPINIKISDGNNNSWTSSFDVRVEI